MNTTNGSGRHRRRLKPSRETKSRDWRPSSTPTTSRRLPRTHYRRRHGLSTVQLPRTALLAMPTSRCTIGYGSGRGCCVMCATSTRRPGYWVVTPTFPSSSVLPRWPSLCIQRVKRQWLGRARRKVSFSVYVWISITHDKNYTNSVISCPPTPHTPSLRLSTRPRKPSRSSSSSTSTPITKRQRSSWRKY